MKKLYLLLNDVKIFFSQLFINIETITSLAQNIKNKVYFVGGFRKWHL